MINIDFNDGGLVDELLNQETLLRENQKLACVGAAMEAREFLCGETKGPKSGEIAKVAELWQVAPTDDGADVFNPSKIASYIETGVGIYDETPGAPQTPIVPKLAKALSWIDPTTGKRMFSKSSKGFKGTAFVRGNWDYLMAIGQSNLSEALQASIEGRRYG